MMRGRKSALKMAHNHPVTGLSPVTATRFFNACDRASLHEPPAVAAPEAAGHSLPAASTGE